MARGLKPGQRHSGQFKKGYDPRRCYGTPLTRGKLEFQELARQKSEKAISILEELLDDPDAPARERRAAAEYIINQAHGSPVQRHLMSDVTENRPGGAVARLLSMLDDAPPVGSETDEAVQYNTPRQNIIISNTSDCIDIDTSVEGNEVSDLGDDGAPVLG